MTTKPVDAERELWELLTAVTDEMNRRAAPGAWLSIAYAAGSKFITTRRAALAATPAPLFAKLIAKHEGLAEELAEIAYTPAQPLSDAQIDTIWRAHTNEAWGKTLISPTVFARHIEHAHGIKGEVTP